LLSILVTIAADVRMPTEEEQRVLVLLEKKAKRSRDRRKEIQKAVEWAMLLLIDSDDEELEDTSEFDHRQRPRSKRRLFKHDEARACVMRDYLGPERLFNGREFEIMFRISRSRFERLLQDIGSSDIPFYRNIIDGLGRVGASLEVRLLLPLKTMAYGVGHHTFRDYFQMSTTMTRKCCVEFDQAIVKLYQDEYLRVPTTEDLKSILTLHKSVHNIDGMFGSFFAARFRCAFLLRFFIVLSISLRFVAARFRCAFLLRFFVVLSISLRFFAARFRCAFLLRRRLCSLAPSLTPHL
jgi:hypothetical protein